MAGVITAGHDWQQGQPGGQPGSAPGGTPSQQPGPSNPSPRPANPTQPNQPSQPNQPGQDQPAQQPGQQQPGQNQPGQDRPGDNRQTPAERRDRTPLNRGDNPRFFTFNDATMEPRFRESATRLAGLERSMTERNQRLTQRLGSIRQLPADRQNAAVMDLLQDILQENAQLQEYLVQSRTLVTGDLGEVADPTRPVTTPNPTQPGTAPAQPGTTPANPTQAPAQPGTAPANPR
jgi:hypothetical protein